MIDAIVAIFFIIFLAILFSVRRNVKKIYFRPSGTRKIEPATADELHKLECVHDQASGERNGDSMALTAIDHKKQLQFQFCQYIREFEQATGMQVTGMKIKRDEFGKIDSLAIKAELPDEEE